MLPSWVMVLKLSKKCIFCNLVLTSARNLSVLKQFTYMNQKVFITVSQKMTCSFVKKDKIKILISDQIAFAAVVYFGQVFGFCRLINKSMLKWFLLIICLNNATLTRSTLLVETIPLAFDWEEKIDRCHWRFTITTFRNIHKKTHVLR